MQIIFAILMPHSNHFLLSARSRRHMFCGILEFGLLFNIVGDMFYSYHIDE